MKEKSLVLKFVIKGNPVPWKRPGQSRYGRYDTQRGLKDSLGSIFLAGMKNLSPLTGKIKLIAIFFMPTPKSLPRKDRDGWHTRKPDLDNLVKLQLDSMNSIVFKDDSQVCAIIAMKGYSEIPRTELTVLEDFDEDDSRTDSDDASGGRCTCGNCGENEIDTGQAAPGGSSSGFA